MKILVVCQHYYPEPLRTSDICEELVKAGHDVSVITDVPNYPMGIVYDGYKKGRNRNEVINGVKVHRCFTIARRKGIIFRFLNYYSFAISSKLYAKRMKEDFDVVFVYQLSPVMMANAGIAYKKKHNKKMLLYCLDQWPESLKAGGIKEQSIVFKYYHKVSNKIYNSADKILITSKTFKNYLMNNFNIKDEVITHLPQYAEALFSPETCKREKDENINLVFAGNVGKVQSIDTIISAAEKTKDINNLYWHIVGDGSKYQDSVDKVKELGLENVVFHGRKPLEEMPKYYKMADAMLVTLQGGNSISETLPGKVQSYMAAGKVVIGAINGETKDVIDEAKCGFCGKADDAEELAQNVRNFIEFKDKDELERNSYKYYLDNFEKEKFVNKLVSELDKLTK